jgi:uncharacterized protein YkwD
MMTHLTMRGRVMLTAAAVASSAALALGGLPAASAAGGQSHHHVRRYDQSLLARVNSARKHNARHPYAMGSRMHTVAQKWAEHLSVTGVLQHNPQLEAEATKHCPNWTELGENVGFASGDRSAPLFSAYMHSPPHRANILDKHYTVVAIATVSKTVDGVTTQWNVMDFVNHCR